MLQLAKQQVVRNAAFAGASSHAPSILDLPRSASTSSPPSFNRTWRLTAVDTHGNTVEYGSDVSKFYHNLTFLSSNKFYASYPKSDDLIQDGFAKDLLHTIQTFKSHGIKIIQKSKIKTLIAIIKNDKINSTSTLASASIATYSAYELALICAGAPAQIARTVATFLIANGFTASSAAIASAFGIGGLCAIGAYLAFKFGKNAYLAWKTSVQQDPVIVMMPPEQQTDGSIKVQMVPMMAEQSAAGLIKEREDVDGYTELSYYVEEGEADELQREVDRSFLVMSVMDVVRSETSCEPGHEETWTVLESTGWSPFRAAGVLVDKYTKEEGKE